MLGSRAKSCRGWKAVREMLSCATVSRPGLHDIISCGVLMGYLQASTFGSLQAFPKG
jgi:hypothetical protein